jgi:hypothetical protein
MTEEIEEQISEIKILRLITGEDIIGTCLFDDEDSNLMIDSPMKVIISRVSESGKTMLMMMPWLPLEIVNENLATINYSDILTIVNPKAEFVEYYFDTAHRYELLMEKSHLEDSSFENEMDDLFEEELDDEDETIEEMLEILKERKHKSIH